jgi:hypothetical protein
MGKLTVVNSVTLDGVTQGLGRPDEDTRNGFEHGGWGVAYGDEVIGQEMGKRMASTGGILLGPPFPSGSFSRRRTSCRPSVSSR